MANFGDIWPEHVGTARPERAEDRTERLRQPAPKSTNEAPAGRNGSRMLARSSVKTPKSTELPAQPTGAADTRTFLPHRSSV
ncbi:MAG: hypothetical protein JWO93_833 [Micrococcaceae bacterium]|nr:hypothetical protein [Micrococcaceae bacterium]